MYVRTDLCTNESECVHNIQIPTCRNMCHDEACCECALVYTVHVHALTHASVSTFARFLPSEGYIDTRRARKHTPEGGIAIWYSIA